MRRVTIALPDALYAELKEVSTATEERGYGPAHWAGDLICAELAARRLPKVRVGANGPRILADE